MKRRANRRAVFSCVPLGLSALLYGAAIKSGAQTTASAASSASTAPTTSPAPAFAAMAYYDQNCAHCHGPQGTFYGPTLGQKLNDTELQKKVDFMATGPGNAPMTADQLAVETAFHRALIMRMPFVSVTQMGDGNGNGGQWAGEAMPDATVVILIGKQRIEATSDDYSWTAQLPAGTNALDVKITAELQGATTTLKPAEASYSNSAPLPPPQNRPK